jgi:hypothetical protein
VLKKTATGSYSEPHESRSPSHPISPRFILILLFHLRLGLPSGVLPSTKILYAFVITPMSATCTDHLILIDLITLVIFGEGYML